jgi:TolB protein
VLGVLVGIVVPILALPAAGARSAYDDSQLIAFTRADGIYVMRADGRDVHPLKRGRAAAGASGLAWSSDGRKLAFASRQSIWTMNADGTQLTRVVTAAQISAKVLGEPTWSPLGRRIAFSAGTGQLDIWLVDADGTNAHRLLRTPERSEFQVDWSPFGNRLAFTDLDWFVHSYVMSTNGTHVRAVNPGWILQAAMPHWSPQGTRLAFMGWPGSDSPMPSMRETEIWVTDVDSYARQLTRNSVTDSDPSWSGDGSRIVFLRGREEHLLFVGAEKRSAGEIYVMNADGTGVTRLTHNRLGEGSPAWQPGFPA